VRFVEERVRRLRQQLATRLAVVDVRLDVGALGDADAAADEIEERVLREVAQACRIQRVGLSSTFLAHAPSATPAAELDEALERAWRAARAAWPALSVDEDGFARHLAARLDGEEPLRALAQVHAADLYLACACAAGDRIAVAAFDERFRGRFALYLSRIDAAPAFVDEVRQILRERLLVGERKIGDYTGRGALESWLRVAAIRTALTLRRAQRNSVPADDAAHVMSPTSDPELNYIKVRYRQEFAEAFSGALAQLSTRQRNVLRLYFLDGLTLEKIGVLHKVNRSTVLRWIAASQEALLDEMRRRLRDRLQITASEFDSLMGLVQSQLDVSLQGFLRNSQG
jgi:RNA polymerase sigma-70 factor (ECF subfamily)